MFHSITLFRSPLLFCMCFSGMLSVTLLTGLQCKLERRILPYVICNSECKASILLNESKWHLKKTGQTNILLCSDIVVTSWITAVFETGREHIIQLTNCQDELTTTPKPKAKGDCESSQKFGLSGPRGFAVCVSGKEEHISTEKIEKGQGQSQTAWRSSWKHGVWHWKRPGERFLD